MDALLKAEPGLDRETVATSVRATLPVFMAAGRMDRMIPQNNTQRLADLLTEAGAEVDLRWRNVGHPLTYDDVSEAKQWLASLLPQLSGAQDIR